MNGSEVETRFKSAPPSTTIGSNKIVDLSLAEKQDLVLFSGTPAYAAILKLMEAMLVEARDEAVLISPSKREERLAALDTAHAMSQCFLGLKQKIRFLVDEQLGEFKRREVEQTLQEQSALEDIIFSEINSGH